MQKQAKSKLSNITQQQSALPIPFTKGNDTQSKSGLEQGDGFGSLLKFFYVFCGLLEFVSIFADFVEVSGTPQMLRGAGVPLPENKKYQMPISCFW